MSSEPHRLRILIIGGSGFLSSTIAQVALAQGHQVWAITRGKRRLPEGVIGLIADRHDHAAFARVIAGAAQPWDLVVDCIAFDAGDAQQDMVVFPSLARQLVLVSTDFVYDPAHRRFPQDEESAYYAADGYGGNKRRCELTLIAGNGSRMPWTIVRPCHIYGPGSQLGCLPLHGRDPRLIGRLQAGEPIRLVGGGHFLQQPILARDLAALILSMTGNSRTYGQVFCAAGPEIIESRDYYRGIAAILGVDLRLEEVPVAEHLAAHPDAAPFLCHRIYDLTKLRASGVQVPRTPLDVGLREHVASLLAHQ
ncbi:MAG: NAD-dependent epimerase/dehydratase family protein [Chloroflexota bacterium]|nr:NAD-dependent epimerase/dehydratase family protein [Chloroflexota bacterium]